MMLQPDTGPKPEPTIAVRRGLLQRLRALLDDPGLTGDDPTADRVELDALLQAPTMENDGKAGGAGFVAWGGGVAEPVKPEPYPTPAWSRREDEPGTKGGG